MIKLLKKATKMIKILVAISLLSVTFILIGVKFSNNFWGVATGTIGTILLTNIVLGIINKQVDDMELIEKVCGYIKTETNVNKLGVVEIETADDETATSKIVKEAEENIDILHVSGRSWTSNNRSEIIKKLKNTKIKIRVILSDYRKEYITNIYDNQFVDSDESFSHRITIIIDQ